MISNSEINNFLLSVLVNISSVPTILSMRISCSNNCELDSKSGTTSIEKSSFDKKSRDISVNCLATSIQYSNSTLSSGKSFASIHCLGFNSLKLIL